MTTNRFPCTMGILTYNSGERLARCLESVKEFGEILIADGGSTDDTLAIARRYGCRIMQQSAQGRPIRDFASERNRMVEAAAYDWFFYIDSDEIASTELVAAIREIVTQAQPKHLIYWVRFCKTSADFSRVYRTFKEYYQPRFFNRTSGARFRRPMHERVTYDESKYTAGRIEAPWYVALEDEDLTFASAMQKSRERLKVLSETWRPRGFADTVWFILLRPIVETAKSLLKMVYVKVRFGRDGVPVRYEVLRIYSHWTSAYMAGRHVVRSLLQKT